MTVKNMPFLHSASATTSNGSVKKMLKTKSNDCKTSCILNILACFPQKGLIVYTVPLPTQLVPKYNQQLQSQSGHMVQNSGDREAASPYMCLINNDSGWSRHELMEAAISLVYEALGDNANSLYICSGKYLMIGRNRHI